MFAQDQARKWKVALIVVLTGGILCLHYFTQYHFASRHAVYRMLFYLPLVLGSFWFGFKGAIGVSIAVNFFYLPYVISNWQGFLDNVDKLLEGVLYIFIALILGYLAERERKQERARRQAESLASIGKAVSEIAHDMKSPLMAIGGFTNQVSRKLLPDDPNRKKLDMVADETARLESMVKEMLDFGRPLQLQTRMERLNHLAEECVEFSHSIAESKEIEIKTEFAPELPSQELDKNRIKQVILNLITNAIQASSSGTIVWVRTRVGKNETLMEVSDCGCGIREQDHKKVFEPFFSTKKDGTGLGLPIVKKIVELHGGNISLHSNPESGVTFIITLPFGLATKGQSSKG